MPFDKYLKHSNIKKKIDEGLSSIPGSKTPDIPKEILDTRIEELTPIRTLVEDVGVLAEDVQSRIQGVIDDIVNTNKSDAGFLLYHKIIVANHFNPSTLINDINARPSQKYSDIQVKAIQRDVYERIVDPRAPFIEDLYNMKAEAGVTEYVMKRVWKDFVYPNQLFDSFDNEDRISRFSIFKDKQNLVGIRDQSDKISRMPKRSLGSDFAEAFGRKIQNEYEVVDYSEYVNQTRSLVRMLKQIRVLLVVASFPIRDIWERYSTDLRNQFKDVLSVVADEVKKSQCYAVSSGVQDLVLGFTEGLENLLDVDVGSTDSVREFRNQIDTVLAKNLEDIESDLLAKEGRMIDRTEKRNVLYLDSLKNLKNKQYIDAISSLIVFLEDFAATLSSSQYVEQDSIKKLVKDIGNSGDEFVRRISTRPYKPEQIGVVLIDTGVA